MFRHPKYYKELRKRNKSDQVISPEVHDGARERAPGPGLKQQVTSYKPQASSAKLFEEEATSLKPQATSLKRQATSCKLSDS